MNKNTILITIFIGALIIGSGIWHIAEAADASVYVFPKEASKEVGDTFDIAVKIDPKGQKVCAAEGNLSLSKLTCQKITMGSGISPQAAPSCDDLNFLLGIQGCSTSKKTLFTIKVKANDAGAGAVNFTGVDIIGKGVSLGSASIGGNYEMTVPSAPPTTPPASPSIPSAPTTPPASPPIPSAPSAPSAPPAPPVSCVCEDWGAWQNRDCGQGDCVDTQRLQERTRVCAPLGCDVEQQTQCINDLACIASAGEEPTEVAETADKSFLASISAFFGDLEGWRLALMFLLGIILALIILRLIKSRIDRNKHKQ